MTARIGLIGRGNWSRNIARTLATFSDARVVKIDAHDGVDLSLDGVVIANGSASHAAAALPYLEAGIATFIEKPMTTSIADAERIRRAALDSGAPVLVGHLHLYNPAFEQLLSTLPELGPIEYIFCESANNKPRKDCSVLWDWLPHDLSMLQKIFGGPPNLVAAWQLCQESTPHVAVVRFSYGEQTCISTISWRSALARKSMTVVAGNGTLVFDDRADPKLVVHSASGTSSHLCHSDEPPLAREMAAFLRVARTRKAPRASLDLAVSIAYSIDAAEQSIKLGGASVQISATGP